MRAGTQGEAESSMTRRGLMARGLISGLRHLAARITDAVVPPVCLSCQTLLSMHNSLCPECWRQIDFIRPPLCDRLGLPLPFDIGGRMISAAASAKPPLYQRARAVAIYDGVMRHLIHEFKYHDRHELRRLFGRWLFQAGGELIETADIIVPVPLNRIRLLRRRFNQAAILAGEVGRLSGIEHLPTALRRVRATPTQVGLTHEQRRQNVRGAFAVRARDRVKFRGRRVLLIDDVITTGATAEACTKTLLDAGADGVDVLALALVSAPTQMTT